MITLKSIIETAKLQREAIKPITEKDQLYFGTASAAADYARTQAEKRGFQINDEDWNSEITMGGRYSRMRPGVGKMHSFSIGLLKDEKPQKKNLNISIYGMESGKFELTHYIS